MYLYELAKITDQSKEDIILWFNQNYTVIKHTTYNPADRLSKFDLDKDSSDLWIQQTISILNLP